MDTLMWLQSRYLVCCPGDSGYITYIQWCACFFLQLQIELKIWDEKRQLTHLSDR